MPVNSHKQVPSSIIQNFTHKDNVDGKKIIKIYVYDFKTKEVINHDFKTFGSEYGYFDDEVEELLKDKYETPFGDFKKKVYKFINRKIPELLITKEDYIHSMNFLKCLIMRNKMQADFFNSHLYSSIICPLNINEYIKLAEAFDIVPFDDFSNYSVTVMVSNCKKRFINNLSGFTTIILRDEKHPSFFVPICPYGGLYFYYPTDGNVYKEMQLANEQAVLEINRRTFLSEKSTSSDSIFSLEANDLVETLDYLKNK